MHVAAGGDVYFIAVVGSDPIRSRENDAAKHNLLTSVCPFFSHCPQCFVEVEIKGVGGVGGV